MNPVGPPSLKSPYDKSLIEPTNHHSLEASGVEVPSNRTPLPYFQDDCTKKQTGIGSSNLGKHWKILSPYNETKQC